MVGQHQPVGRHERARAASQSNRGRLHALDPRVVEVYTERLLYGRFGNAIEQPEALVGVANERREQNDGGNDRHEPALSDSHNLRLSAAGDSLVKKGVRMARATLGWSQG